MGISGRKIVPVILSGGSGSRLWPLSRRTKPKQFLNIGDENSLLEQTLLRCSDTSIFSEKPIIVGSVEHRFYIAEAAKNLGLEVEILLEPVPRNSCPAIASACLHALKTDKDATLLVLATDHYIPDVDAFTRSVTAAQPDLQNGHLIMFGVEPTKAATGYGYIFPAKKLEAAYEVKRFIEKPNLEIAEKLIGQGCLWNSGNFLFRADSFISELKKYEPEIFSSVEQSLSKSKIDLGFVRLDKEAFANSKSISLDYAILERSNKVAVLPVNYSWSDIGSWTAVGDILKLDENDNAKEGNVFSVKSANNIAVSDHRLLTLVGIEDIIVVATRDAVLVANKKEAEAVKDLVDSLDENNKSEVYKSPKEYRPWGGYEKLDSGDQYQVKRIVVKPGGELSLQKHKYRAEHWVVVDGIAEVTIDGKTQILQANESVYVPQGSIHKLANKHDQPLSLIEVQTGTYLGEDDIVRLSDAYGRGEGDL